MSLYESNSTFYLDDGPVTIAETDHGSIQLTTENALGGQSKSVIVKCPFLVGRVQINTVILTTLNFVSNNVNTNMTALDGISFQAFQKSIGMHTSALCFP